MVSEHISFLSDNSIGGEHGDEPDDEVGDSYPKRLILFKSLSFSKNKLNIISVSFSLKITPNPKDVDLGRISEVS